MALNDVEDLLQHVASCDSCGQDLEDGDLYRRFESEIGSDSTDWLAVEGMALELLQETKDVRVFVGLIAATLRDPARGLNEFRKAITALRQTLERQGDAVHPRVEGDSPTSGLRARAMAIDELGSPFGTSGDEYQVVARLRLVPLTTAGETFTFRDLMIMRGELANVEIDESEKSERESAFQAAISQTVSRDRERLAALAEDAEESLRELEAIDRSFAERKLEVTGVPSLELEALTDQLQTMASEIAKHLPSEAAAPVDPAIAEGAVQLDAGGDASVASVAPVAASSNGAAPSAAGGLDQIRTRADVLAALEAIQTYYREHEPSSPVPMLLQRAGRFVNMNFVDIVQDIAGDNIDNMQVIFGSRDGSDD